MTDQLHQLVHQTPVSKLLKGRVDVRECLARLQIYQNDTVELLDDTVSIPLEPGFMTGVILEGHLDISLANVRHLISAKQAATVYAIQVQQSTHLIRHLQSGNRVRRVHVWVPASELGRLLTTTDRQHLPASGQIAVAEATPEIVTQAGNLMTREKTDATPATVAANALQLVAACLHAFRTKPCSFPRALPEKQHRQAKRLEAYLNDRTNNDDSKHLLRDMSSELGLSISSLQRLSQSLYGTTIKDHLRQRQLNAARDALLSGASIGEASYIAGYRHTSNFSAAFKRAFDAPPGAFLSSRQSP